MLHRDPRAGLVALTPRLETIGPGAIDWDIMIRTWRAGRPGAALPSRDHWHRHGARLAGTLRVGLRLQVTGTCHCAMRPQWRRLCTRVKSTPAPSDGGPECQCTVTLGGPGCGPGCSVASDVPTPEHRAQLDLEATGSTEGADTGTGTVAPQRSPSAARARARAPSESPIRPPAGLGDPAPAGKPPISSC